jgi:predicted PurR-regulated permease PerM
MGIFRASSPQDRELIAQTAKRTTVVYAVVLLVTIVLGILYLLRAVALQLLVSLVLAVALEPFVQVFLRRKIRRVWAVLLAMTISLTALVVIIGAVVTPLITEGLKLSDNAGSIADTIITQSHLEEADQKYHLADKVRSFSQTIARDLTASGQPIVTVFGSIAGGAETFAIIVVFVFFLLLEGPDGWRRCTRYLDPVHAQRIDHIAEKMMTAVSGFVSGNLLISLIAGLVALVTLLILGVPYAFALAVLLAIFDLIPLVGAAIGTIVIAVVALTKGVVTMLIAVAVLLIYQFVEGHVIQPLVYSRAIPPSSAPITEARTIINGESAIAREYTSGWITCPSTN